MKDMDSTAVGRAPAPEPEYSNRKLIRPTLNRGELNRTEQAQTLERRERSTDRVVGGGTGGRKAAPPEQTHAENFYYQKQMQAKTPMVVVLQDGEELHGVIEWYDKNCIKMLRHGAGNIVVYKAAIKYMFKESERR